MPIIRLQPSRRRDLLAACAFLAVGIMSPMRGAERAAVSVVRSAPWSPNDPARDGAEEFAVLMQLAQVQRTSRLAGLIGVGAPHGMFQNGAERALRFAVCSGVPVVKLATRGRVAATPDELFIDAGSLSETEASRVLADALARLGAPPRATNPSRPTAAELEAVRAHVQRIQEHFALAATPRLAAQ